MHPEGRLLSGMCILVNYNSFPPSFTPPQCYELASEGNLGEAYTQAKKAMHSAGEEPGL